MAIKTITRATERGSAGRGNAYGPDNRMPGISADASRIRAFFAALYTPYGEAIEQRAGQLPLGLGIDLRALWPQDSAQGQEKVAQGKSLIADSLVFPHVLNMPSTMDVGPASWAAQWTLRTDIFFSPVLKSREGQSDNDTVLATCLFGEVDNDMYTPDAALNARDFLLRRLDAAGLPRPSVLVTTRKGCHFYFLLKEAAPLIGDTSRKMFSATLKRLASAIGGEGTLHADFAPARVGGNLRPAGTYNLKELTAPVLLTASYSEAETQTLAWWRNVLPRLPDSELRRNAQEWTKPQTPQELPPEAIALLSGSCPNGRNNGLIRLLGICAKIGWDETMMYGIAESFCINTGLPESEGRSAVKSAIHNFKEFR